MLTAPVSYQGGKQRLAGSILDIIAVCPDQKFYDLCCGSGAVSIELVNRGHSPSSIRMVDAGPWGLFWRAVGEGTFDLDKFRSYVAAIPPNPSHIAGYLKELSSAPVADDAPYVFLLLQAGSFGGKAIWTANGRWQNTSFRAYWQPTETSSRRSPVNPMMPMPFSLLERVESVVCGMRGIRALCADVQQIKPTAGSVVYLDPPYDGTTSYGHTLAVSAVASCCKGSTLWVSEGRPLSDEAHCLSNGRPKGGISGQRALANAEWLSKL